MFDNLHTKHNLRVDTPATSGKVTKPRKFLIDGYTLMSKFKYRFVIILISILAIILVFAYATGLLGVVVEEVVWRLSNIYWKPL